MEKDFKVVKDGTTLTITLSVELSAANGPALKDELSKYSSQGIERVVFDASGLTYLSSGGLQAIIYADHRFSSNKELVIVNCAKEIREVLNHVGLTPFIKFEENLKMKEGFHQRMEKIFDEEELNQKISERNQTLDNYAAHNDLVCYNMKLGEED